MKISTKNIDRKARGKAGFSSTFNSYKSISTITFKN